MHSAGLLRVPAGEARKDPSTSTSAGFSRLEDRAGILMASRPDPRSSTSNSTRSGYGGMSAHTTFKACCIVCRNPSFPGRARIRVLCGWCASRSIASQSRFNQRGRVDRVLGRRSAIPGFESLSAGGLKIGKCGNDVCRRPMQRQPLVSEPIGKVDRGKGVVCVVPAALGMEHSTPERELHPGKRKGE
jgi:hypothetical protein